jgi:hypothetical protein
VSGGGDNELRCRLAREQEQRQLSMSDGEEEKWERPSPTVPTRKGISPSPLGAAAGRWRSDGSKWRRPQSEH